MSYILDALKKSDQQRQRGTAPALPIAQITVAGPKRPLFIFYGLLAAALLATGVMIGWLHPWQHEQTLPETEPITAESPIPISQQTIPAPLPVSPEMHNKTVSTSAVQPVPVVGAMKPSDTAPASAEPGAAEPVPDKPAKPAGVAPEQEAVPLNELPLTIQQEIPAMTVQLHAYSGNSSERLVSVNSTRLREGEYLMPGLRLEQITPDGMIFSYKGYRFRRGIR